MSDLAHRVLEYRMVSLLHEGMIKMVRGRQATTATSPSTAAPRSCSRWSSAIFAAHLLGDTLKLAPAAESKP